MNKKMRLLSLVMIIAVLFTQLAVSAYAANVTTDEQTNTISDNALSGYVSDKPLMYNPQEDTLTQQIAQNEKDLDIGRSKVRKSSVTKTISEKLPSSFSLKGTKYLPPITNQGQIGSCASESITYMQFSNAIARYVEKNGIDSSWNPSANVANTFSPKWTYNQVGANILRVYDILADHGAATYDKVKFDDNLNGHVKNVSANTVAIPTDDIMLNALNYRLASKDAYDTYNIVDYDKCFTEGNGKYVINKIKQALTDGNVVVTAGHPSRWIYTTVSKSGDIAKTGEYCVAAAQGFDQGRHAVSIVGYDDNVEAKFGGKTLKGAFLVANSWGITWKNRGFAWFMYDSINTQSMYEELNSEEIYQGGMNFTIENSLVVYSSSYFSESSNWQFSDVGSKTINGKEYRKYTISRSSSIDATVGPYISLQANNDNSFIVLTNQATNCSEWCLIPYEDVINLPGFKSENYASKYDGTYWICPANTPTPGASFINSGTNVSTQGRKVSLSSFNDGANPQAKSYTLSGKTDTKQGENFITRVVVTASPIQRLSRMPALDYFTITYWNEDYEVGMPDLILSADVSSYNRDDVSFKLCNSRIITDYITPACFYHKSYRPYSGYSFSGKAANSLAQPETVKMYFNLDSISLFRDHKYEDYNWGMKITNDNASSNSVTISNVNIIAGKSNTVLGGKKDATVVSPDSSAYISCKITEYPTVDTNAKAKVTAASASNSITVNWDKVSDANGYVVYRRSPGEQYFYKQATLTSSLSNRYVDTNCESGNVYYYMVKPYSSYSAGYTIGAASYQSNAGVLLGTTKLTTCKETAEGIKLVWNKASGANGYRVLKRKPSEKVWQVAATLGDKCDYICNDIEKDVIYAFSVQPIYTFGDTVAYGQFDTIGNKICLHSQSSEYDYVFEYAPVYIKPNSMLCNGTIIPGAISKFAFNTEDVINGIANIYIEVDSKDIEEFGSYLFLDLLGITSKNDASYNSMVNDLENGRSININLEISTACLTIDENEINLDTDVPVEITDASMGEDPDLLISALISSDLGYTVADSEYEEFDSGSDSDILGENIIYDFRLNDTVHLKSGSQFGDNEVITGEALSLDYKIVSIDDEWVILRLDVNAALLDKLQLNYDEFIALLGCDSESEEFDYQQYVTSMTSGKGFSFYMNIPMSSLSYEAPKLLSLPDDTDSDYGYVAGDIVHLKENTASKYGTAVSPEAANLNYKVLKTENGVSALMLNIDKPFLESLGVSLTEFFTMMGLDNYALSGIDYNYVSTVIENEGAYSLIIFVDAKDVVTTDKKYIRRYGDVDGNGEINMVDVTIIQKVMAKLAEFKSYGESAHDNADCDHSGQINMQDVTLLQKYIAKLVTEL
ncbi:MAG: hypothetical protein K6F76_08340 [Clostridiales bacterium]|nr:hypothetical protein [Clostridiales bacterium]